MKALTRFAGSKGRFLLALLSGLCQCAQGDTYQAVVVKVDASQVALPLIQNLEVTASLNGKEAAGGPLNVTPAMMSFTLLVAVDQSGPLNVSVRGYSGRKELLAGGTDRVALSGTGEYALTLLLRPEVPDPATLSFAMPVFYPPPNLGTLAAGDVNGDQLPDLVGATFDTTQVSVLLNQGQGIFSMKTGIVDTAQAVYSMALGDLDGDGHLDIVVVDVELGQIGVLRGKGDGTFQPVLQSPTTIQGPQVIDVRDMDRDGHLDLVLLSGVGVTILPGKGNGTFGTAKTTDAGKFPVGAAVGDLNQDGKTDVAVTNQAGVRVLLGNGDGTFASGQNVAGIPAGFTRIALSDRDLAVTDPMQAAVVIYSGTGDGITFLSGKTVPTDKRAYTVRSADVNGDLKPDFLVTNFDGNTVSVILANGDGTFQPARNFPSGTQPVEVVALDADGDGKNDLALVAAQMIEGTPQISLLLNTSR